MHPAVVFQSGDFYKNQQLNQLGDNDVENLEIVNLKLVIKVN